MIFVIKKYKHLITAKDEFVKEIANANCSHLKQHLIFISPFDLMTFSPWRHVRFDWMTFTPWCHALALCVHSEDHTHSVEVFSLFDATMNYFQN